MVPQVCQTHGFRFCIIFLCLASLLQAGCSSNPEKKQAPIKNELEYFNKSQAALNTGNYLLAIEQLEKLETNYPFGRYTAQAQLDLIYAHYKSGTHASAELAANRFIDQHPEHPELAYAYYLLALSAYDVDRGFITRVLPSTPAERNMKPVIKSYQKFRELVTRFPDSEYTPDARQRMIYLRNLLAQHEIGIGEYYLRRGAYVASINRGHYVIKNFPLSTSVPKALALATKGYKELKMTDEAELTEETLAYNFPDYPELEQDKLQYTPQSLRSERSWLNIMSFGLVGSDGSK